MILLLIFASINILAQFNEHKGLKKLKVICFGPGPKFKGGLADYNTALAKAMSLQDDVEVEIVSWSQQYPSIIPRDFIDKSSKLDFLKDSNIKVSYLLNYNSPLSWRRTADYIIDSRPDIIIIQWSIALQGLPIGFIVDRIKKRSKIEVLFDLHFVIQKEGSFLDKPLSKFALKKASGFITHAYKTVEELKELLPEFSYTVNESGDRQIDNTSQFKNPYNFKSVIKLFHPIYDLYKPDKNFDVQSFKTANGLNKYVFLFFGFIRKYKGLHFAIEAFYNLAKERDDVSLLVCGESFWNTIDNTKWQNRLKKSLFNLAKRIFLKNKNSEENYNPLELIRKYNIEDKVKVFNSFIPNEDVHKYFQAANYVVLFYEYATPSGIESLSYNFRKPLLATKVGHFPETIEDGKNGYLADPEDIQSMTEIMKKAIEKPLEPGDVEAKTKEMSWSNYAKKILLPYRNSR